MRQNGLSALGALVSAAAISDPVAATSTRKRVAPVTNPTLNRWTGKPHEHKREIARRARQEASK